MKKILIVGLSLALVAGALIAPADAKKKKKKKKPPVATAPVQVDQKFYLRRDACNTENDNTHLSLTDSTDQACWASDAGVLYSVIKQVDEAGGPFNSGVLWEPYPAADGVPLTLDATKPITGEITLYGGQCLTTAACAPASVTAGEATVSYRLFGEINGEEVELGTYDDTFQTTPGENHTSNLEITVDPALDKAVVTALRFEVFKGGTAYGPGGIEYDDPASFLTIPALVTP